MKNNYFKKVAGSLLGFALISAIVWYFNTKQSVQPSIIIVSKEKIANAGRISVGDWISSNQGYIYQGVPTHPVTNCGTVDKWVAIDLNLISTSNTYVVRKWLRKNSPYICFEDSYEYIEEAHIITDAGYKNSIDNATEKRPITFEELKTATNTLLTPVLRDFETHGYQGYLNFFSFLGNTKFVYDYGIIGEGRYSIPFFRAIRARVNRDLGVLVPEKDITLTFVQVKNPQGNGVIAFTVEAKAGIRTFKEYYNFSTDPGKPITCMIY